MALDLRLFGDKLKRYREQLQLSLAEVSHATGISEARLAVFEHGEGFPTGDDILILADFVTTQLPKQLRNRDRSVYAPSHEPSNAHRPRHP